MRVIKRKNKKAVLIAILAFSLAVLIAGAAVLNTLLQVDDGSADTPALPEILEGEAIYNGMAIAYPYIAEKNIIGLVVKGIENDYSLMREPIEKDGKTTYGSFILSYKDSSGETQTYAPGILSEDSETDYSDLYAIEQGDGYGTIPKLTYLCTAVGALYFNERIELSANAEERTEQLKRYGLTSSSSVTIGFSFLNGKGEEEDHIVTIGSSIVTGFGYYYLVDDRPYVYSVENNNYFNYALADFTTFVNPALTAAGLAIDGAFEPYLTTAFEQWKNTVYDDNDPFKRDEKGNYILDDNGDKIYDGIVDYVKDGSIVAVNASLITPNGTEGDGYSKGKTKGVTFDLSDIGNDELLKYTLSVLKNKPLGVLDKHFYVTMMDYASAKLLDAEKLDVGTTYQYFITEIESVIDSNGEHTEAGYAVGDAKYVKIGYLVKVDNGELSAVTQHSIINLNDEILPDEVKSAIAAARVGTLDSQIGFSIKYTKDNSIKRNILITEIITILDSNNKTIDKVADGSQVMYRYQYEINGVAIENYGTAVITVGSNLEGQDKEIAGALMGKGQSKNLSIRISDGNYTVMNSFTSYEISEISYFVTKQPIVSFRFQQASQRNPYYGESLYENTMTGEYSMYALNASACEAVVKVLGGIGANASQSIGISGLKTVAVGITPDIMKEYGLYAYSVYFELPRGITTVKYLEDLESEEYLDELDDYTYYSTLGFNLYMSEPFKDKSDNKYYRYVASDMYDLVAVCPAEDFEFLEYGFVEFYARRNMMLTDIANIHTIKFDFFMEDVYGSYVNQFDHNQLYAYNGKLYSKEALISQFGESALSLSSKFEAININVIPGENCMETEFSKFLSEKGYTQASLYEFFDKELLELDSLGTSNFKELTELIFYTYYEGYFESEVELDPDNKLMAMTVTLGEMDKEGDYNTYSAYDYVYEFYRTSDRRVAVKLYRQNRDNGEVIDVVTDFYISTFAFKKIVTAYTSILDKELINSETAYG